MWDIKLISGTSKAQRSVKVEGNIKVRDEDSSWTCWSAREKIQYTKDYLL